MEIFLIIFEQNLWYACLIAILVVFVDDWAKRQDWK